MTDAEIKERIEQLSRESDLGCGLIIRHRIRYDFRIEIRRASDDIRPDKRRERQYDTDTC